MARIVSLSASGIATTASTKTLLTGKPTGNQGGVCLECSISYNGVTASNVPHLVRICKVTTDGTGTNVAPVKVSEFSGTADLTGTSDFSAEPTQGDILDEQYVSPNNGFYVWSWAGVGGVQLAKNERIAIKVVSPANTTNCCVNMKFGL